jgi:predicted DNA-binding protein
MLAEMMIRTQVQLTEAQMSALRQLSAETGKSAAELIRNGIDQYLAGRRAPSAEDRIERALRVAGSFASGGSDGSAKHDRYLAEAFRQ